MRVLLCYKCSEDGRSDFFERILPVGLCSLNAVLRERGHHSSLANFSRTAWGRIESVLREVQPALVGISTFTFNRHASLRLARVVKRVLPGARVVLGGPHASHLSRAILDENPAVDFIVVGEGEDTLARLVHALEAGEDPSSLRGIAGRANGGPTAGRWPEPIADLDRLPLPLEGFEAMGVDPRIQFMYLITSRGCPARCSFCNTPDFWGTRIRFRSVDHVLREMRRLREEYGLLYLSIRDDTFTVNRRRVLELCERMREERLYFLWDCQSRVNAVDEERLVAMRRAGCVHIQYGVESGSPRMLEILNKDIRPAQIVEAARATRDAGLVFSVYLITGAEGEGEKDLRATESILETTRPHDAMVSPLAVFPGTALWEDWKKRRGVGDEYWTERGREDVYVRTGDRAVEESLERIGLAVEAGAARNAYTLEDYRAQRARVGNCHALDLAEADLHRLEDRPEDAGRVLLRLLAREEDNPWGSLRLGQLRMDLGAFAEACGHFAEVVRRVPRLAEGHALHARALARLGRKQDAERSFARALALDPHHAAARRALRRPGQMEASAPLGPRSGGRQALLRSG